MAVADDLINFDVIESHKENIQSLPGGRSARQLASLLSPLPSGKAPGLNETKTLNDAIRQEYEIELQSIADSDDPLDIYDRYVKWTLNAYPSAQATPQSQLLPLLERATKAFLTSPHYKNDPRYLKLWLHYIRFFSDAPRETFAFMARHHIGEGLGLFYEEFATWLESAGRWNQAEEVYTMGVEREARPIERLMRKFEQFKQRFEARPHDTNEPSSPALPTVRPALAAKIDPFASAPRSEDPQAARPASSTASTARSGRQKMAIFSDADDSAAQAPTSNTKGWDSIDSMRERKKENTIEARPWSGETLKAGKKVGSIPKMEIFKDPTSRNSEHKKPHGSQNENVNPRTGRSEKVFVNIEAVYPNENVEYSFEELRSINRGWAQRDWRKRPSSPLKQSSGNVQRSPEMENTPDVTEVENLAQDFQQRVDVNDESTQSMVGMPEPKPIKQRRTKIREVKQEVKTVKTRLESPTGPKIRRKGSSEPTMTFHSKAATNEIYDMFNKPLRQPSREDTQSGDETDFGDDTYSTAGESTGTGKISSPSSEFGDDTLASVSKLEEGTESQPGSVSPWSDFTVSKHVPRLKDTSKHKHPRTDLEETDADQNQTQLSDMGAGFDTQAIAAIANQDFGDLDTKMIAQIAGDVEEEDEEEECENEEESTQSHQQQDLQTPIDEPDMEQIEVNNKPRYIPLPPEDYEPTPLRPYRDPTEMAQHKLPFMTPIVERTESSLAPSTAYNDKDYFDTKTPSRSTIQNTKDESPSKVKIGNLLLESPFRNSSPFVEKRSDKISDAIESKIELENEPIPCPMDEKMETPFSVSNKIIGGSQKRRDEEALNMHGIQQEVRAVSKGPIITDLHCNPCDTAVRDQILATMHPSVTSYAGFSQNLEEAFDQYPAMRSYADKVAKQKGSAKTSPKKGQSDKNSTKLVAPLLKFQGTSRVYAVKRELGKGAFAPVYLVDSIESTDVRNDVIDNEENHNTTDVLNNSSDRLALEALKTESPPGTLVWEFHILRSLRQRLGPMSRTMQSIITAHECHLYRDEAYLVLAYSPQGTLLDLVNLARSESIRAGRPAEGLDEVLAMWISVELLRALEEIHRVGILHGDLKADNCLVRFDTAIDLSQPYSTDGRFGWNSKGITLIDFGRGIDVRNFSPRTQFIADWEASAQDCAEIREMRPWTYQIDYHGAAGVIHSILFGKYIETTVASGSSTGLGQHREWKLKETFKRYWERDIWSEVFNVLLNPTSVQDGETMPIMRNLTRVRTMLEDSLLRESDRSGGGKDLRSAVRKAERMVADATKGKK